MHKRAEQISTVEGAPDAPPRRDALVVLGMHRSGTSAMTRTLSLCGAVLPAEIMPPSAGNLTGHWEPRRVARFNDRLLHAAGSSWDDFFRPRALWSDPDALAEAIAGARELLRQDYGDNNLILLKEPRISRLLDIWRAALEQEGFAPAYVIMVRDPGEVAASLRQRNAMPDHKGLLLWVAHMLAAERGTRGARRIFVEFDRLLEDPQAVIDRVAAVTGLSLSARDAGAAAGIGEFLQPHLKSSAAVDFRKAALFAPVVRLHRYFLAKARMEPADDQVLADTAAWMDDLDALFSPIIGELQVQRTGLQQEIRTLRQQMAVAPAPLTGQTAAGADIEVRPLPKRGPLKRALRTARSVVEGGRRALKTARGLMRRRRPA
jgi:hypothetical protein